MTSPASGPSTSATATARFNSTTGESVRRRELAVEHGDVATSHAAPGCAGDAIAACTT